MIDLPIRTSGNCINKELYKERVSQDVRLKDIANLINLGSTIFDNASPKNIINPLDVGKPNFEKDFWNFKAINGLQSLKQGFYKIISQPENKNMNGIPTWVADVLYNAGNNINEHFQYNANIGTIINRCATAGNLTTRKYEPLPSVKDKEQFLTKLVNRTFYVSRAEYVTNNQYNAMKEVLWFVWNKEE